MSTTFLGFMREFAGSKSVAERSGRILRVMQLALQVNRERRQLSRLTSDELAMLGIDRAAAQREVAKSMFDLPASRLDRLP